MPFRGLLDREILFVHGDGGYLSLFMETGDLRLESLELRNDRMVLDFNCKSEHLPNQQIGGISNSVLDYMETQVHKYQREQQMY